MATKNWVDTWPGGRICLDRRGRRVYVLERQLDGRRRSYTLGPITGGAALAQLALWDQSPLLYQSPRAARAEGPADAVTITAERVKAWLAQLEAEGCTDDYRDDCKRYILAWTEALAGADLRTVKLAELQDALKQPGMAGARAQRIAALRSFTRHLRDLGQLEADASLLLHAPQPRPEKSLRPKGYSADLVRRVYRGLQRQEVRDVICIRALTGQHHTEIDRVAQGRGYITRLEGHGEITGTVTLPHKSGDAHVQSCTAQVLAAYERLQRRGSAPDDRWVARQCDEAVKVLVESKAIPAGTKFNPGELRHTFATLAASSGREVRPASGGLPLAAVAAAMGHHSPKTSKKFYVGAYIPPMVVLPLELVHPEDPRELGAAASRG